MYSLFVFELPLCRDYIIILIKPSPFSSTVAFCCGLCMLKVVYFILLCYRKLCFHEFIIVPTGHLAK